MAVSTSPLSRRLLTGLLFGVLVILGLALASDLRQVSGAVRQFQWASLPLILALTVFNYLLRGVKFHYYLRQVGAARISPKESFRIFVAGFPLAITPGKVGEALKGVWIEQKTEVNAAKGVAVVLAERVSDGIAVLLLSTLGVIAYPRYWPAFALVFGGLVGLMVVTQIRPLSLSLLEGAGRLPLVGRIAGSLREFYEGSYQLFRPVSTLVAVGLGVLSWLGEGVGFYLILLGLGVTPSWQALSLAVFILSFSTVVGAVSALPGGLGAAEASISGMLILLLGLSPGTAAAATLLVRFATLWFGVALGVLVWGTSRDLLGFTGRQPISQEPANQDELHAS